MEDNKSSKQSEQEFREDFLRMNKEQQTVVLILAMRFLEQLMIRKARENAGGEGLAGLPAQLRELPLN